MPQVSVEEEFERFKRFQAEQYKQYGVKLIELENLIKNYSPGPGMAAKTKDLLAKQVEGMFKKLTFLEQEIIKIKKQLGIE